MFWLVFLVPHLNLTSDYHLEVHRHHLSQFSLSEALPDILSDLLPPSRPGATCLYLVPLVYTWCHLSILGATCLYLVPLVSEPFQSLENIIGHCNLPKEPQKPPPTAS